MAGFVPDASVTLPWYFHDEATAWTEGLLDRVAAGEEIRVPAHWPLEVLNALLVAQRRGRISGKQVRDFIHDLNSLAILVESASPPAQRLTILALAENHGLTTYDAAYLQLAQRSALPLVTLDRDLLTAARMLGLSIL